MADDNVAAFLQRLQSHEERVAVVFRGSAHTYRELAADVARLAADLQGRVSPGDIVALCTDYSYEAVCTFIALASLRVVVVPVTTEVAAEVEQRLEIVGASHVIRLAADGRCELAARAVTTGRSPLLSRVTDLGHPALVLFSSGSTGRPKAMVHDLDRLLGVYLERRGRDLVFLVFLMFDHIGGLNTLLNGLAAGGKLVLAHSREPDEVCRLVADNSVNVLPASPTFLNLILMSGAHRQYDMRSLKMITYGTEAMPDQLLARVREAFPRARLLQTFGTSETGIAQTASRSSGETLMRIDDPNTDVRVVDGELWLRSRTQIVGYLNADMDSFTEDGWFRTGDLVEEAPDGYFRIRGRRKEVINVGGEKVLPVEVETVILELDSIADCMAYAEPNPITGQCVAVEVVLAAGIEPATARRDIRAHCLRRLERYKVPARITVVDRTGYGERFKKMRLRAP